MPRAHQANHIPADVLEILRCPLTGAPLRQDGDSLVSAHDDTIRYPIDHGVPTLLADGVVRDAEKETP